MLDVMRKNAGSLLIKIILGLIIVVFVMWGVGSPPGKKPKFVRVNDQKISQPEHYQAYQALLERARQYGGDLDENMENLLKQQALDQLINSRLLLSEAYKLDIRVSDQELYKAVAEMPFFQVDGQFNSQRYRQLLQQNRKTTQDFESELRTSMLIDKVRNNYLDSIKTSKEEALQWYRWQNKQVNIAYALFKAEDVKEVEVSEAEIKSYFESNQKRYEMLPKRKAQYLRFSPQAFSSGVEISDEEIADYYDRNTSEFDVAKTVVARHILIKADQQADAETDAAANKKAQEVYALTQQDEDFAALAKKYSEGPTASAGGLLGEFERERMVKPFADKAFAMQPGEISEPVRTQFGYHIIKVEKVNEARTKPLAEVSQEIREKLVETKSEDLAYEKAGEIADAASANNDLQKLAEEFKLTLKQTEAFTRSGPQGIADKARFAETAFELSVMELSEILELSDGFYIFQVTESVEPRIPAFEEVAQKVRQDLEKEKREQLARQEAEAMLVKLTDGAEMETLGAEIKNSDFFGRRQPSKTIGYDPAVLNAALELTSKNPLTPEVVKGQKGYYVMRLIETRQPEDQAFEKEVEQVMTQLRQQKRNRYFQKWIEDLRNNSKIEMDRGFLG